MLKNHIAYLKYVLRHKWFVLQASSYVNLPLGRALLHDWTKFLPSEWGPYTRYFYAEDGTKAEHTTHTDELSFNAAWNHHQKRNKHHWQYWSLREDSGDVVPIEMPETYVREMIADWIGAGKAINGKSDVHNWWRASRGHIYIHPTTELLVDQIIKKLPPKL